MPHKYLPRVQAGVLTPLVVLAASCHDATEPAEAHQPRLVLATADLPASDSVAQLGFQIEASLSDSSAFDEPRLYVDSASNPVPRQLGLAYPQNTRAVYDVAFAPGPGRHTFTVAVTYASGRVASASVTRTFVLPDAAYTAILLPDLGQGGNAAHVNAAGDVAGWVAPAPGTTPPQPAVWRAGALALVPLPDGATGGRALRVNTSGDVLLELTGAGDARPRAPLAVRRADGVVVWLGPVRYTGAYNAFPQDVSRCCSAGDLNDRREAVGTTADGRSGVALAVSARYDVAAGRIVDSLPGSFSLLNNRGQLAGADGGGFFYFQVHISTAGFALPALPLGASAHVCDHVAPGRSTTNFPLSIDDSAAVLANIECGNIAYLTDAPGGSVWLNRYIGDNSTARLSPQGGIVAALDGAGTVYVWRAAARRAERVRLTNGAWRVDSLGAVNAAGAIAAHGVEAATGRAAALLLTPAR